MSTETFPVSLYASLLPKLAAVLEIAQNVDGALTPSAKQALLQATNDFKSSLAQAREFALALPGGELGIEEQDQIIEMLEKLRDRKQQQLALFSSRAVTSANGNLGEKNVIPAEIDSVASTPV